MSKFGDGSAIGEKLQRVSPERHLRYASHIWLRLEGVCCREILWTIADRIAKWSITFPDLDSPKIVPSLYKLESNASLECLPPAEAS
jgi:hypothetical protein